MHFLAAGENRYPYSINITTALYNYCDVPGSPCLNKTGLFIFLRIPNPVSCRCPEPRVVCWRPHLAGTRQCVTSNIIEIGNFFEPTCALRR